MKTNDPYVALEDVAASKTKVFYDSHNDATDEYLKNTGLDYFADALMQVTDADVRGLTHTYGAYEFWIERKADWKKLKLLCRFKSKETVLLDFDSSDESLDYWFPSPNGKRVVYGTSMNGDERITLHVYDVLKGSVLDDVIPFAGFTDQGSICWLNERSFIYPRMNGFSETGSEDKWLLGTKLYLHNLGDDPSDDRCVFGKDLPDTVMIIPTLSTDKKTLYAAVCEDELTHQVHIVDIDSGNSRVVKAGSKSACHVKSGHGRVYIMTNYDAPRYRLIMAEESDIPDNLDDWDEVLPDTRDILQDFWINKTEAILAQYSHNVTSRLFAYDAYGNQTSHIDLPKSSIIGSVVCNPHVAFIRYSVSGFTLPSTHYQMANVSAEPRRLWQRKGLDGDDQITVTQQFVRQKDGCDVPYFCIKKVDTPEDAPCILYGYGGFNIALEPSYLTSARPWVMAGGVYVLANLRGGSEFGEDWHSSACLEHKQTTFDDCIAIAEDLISSKVTSAEKLGVLGGSNGGLLVAAITMQRPDLFRAGAALVPLTDMLEFYKHQVAEFWVHEYGDPRILEQRTWIEKWSPYQYPVNIESTYPALYYETALFDARVHPMHALKMVARLEAEVSKWKGPLLLRTQVGTGHQGTNLSRQQATRQTAEYYAFFACELGLSLRN